MKRLKAIACAFALALPFSIATSAVAQQADPAWEDDLYDHYDVGYDSDLGDDWFYDEYEYGEEDVFHEDAIGDEYYTGYDYDAGVFEWEEEGLF